MLVAEFKRADGHGLGFEKVGESSDEISGERDRNISTPLHATHGRVSEKRLWIS
jgi:hypothetical protein